MSASILCLVTELSSVLSFIFASTMQRSTYYHLVSDGSLKLEAHPRMRYLKTQSQDKLPSDHKGWVISFPAATKAEKPRWGQTAPPSRPQALCYSRWAHSFLQETVDVINILTILSMSMVNPSLRSKLFSFQCSSRSLQELGKVRAG